MGVISYQRGEFAQAVRQIDFALRVNPHVSDAHNNLGNALKRLGQFREGLWYPTARLYRQRARNNWAPVVSEVGQALNALLTRRR